MTTMLQPRDVESPDEPLRERSVSAPDKTCQAIGFLMMGTGLVAVLFGILSAVAAKNSLATHNFDFELFGFSGLVFMSLGLVAVLVDIVKQDRELDALITHGNNRKRD